MSNTKPKEVSTFEVRIELIGTNPLVWRSLKAASNMSLNSLALAISSTMGWLHYHLYMFEIGGEQYGDIELDDEGTWNDDRQVKLSKLAKTCPEFTYTYDLGDDWKHRISIVRELQASREERYPMLLDGENACPPEDSGGIAAFQEYKVAISDPEHPRHPELLDWRGKYDPSAFDAWLTGARLMQRKIRSNLKIRDLGYRPKIDRLSNSEIGA